MNHVRRLSLRLGLVGVGVVVGLIPMTAFPLATAQAQPAASADLAVAMRWVGSGTPKARVGEFARLAITVTNRGPDTAEATVLSIGTPDQLNPISLTCSCLLPEGESRPATVSAFVNSQAPEVTPDPTPPTTSRPWW